MTKNVFITGGLGQNGKTFGTRGGDHRAAGPVRQTDGVRSRKAVREPGELSVGRGQVPRVRPLLWPGERGVWNPVGSNRQPRWDHYATKLERRVVPVERFLARVKKCRT